MQEKSIQASQLIGREDIKKTRRHHGFRFAARIAPLVIKSFNSLTLPPIVCYDATSDTILPILDATSLLRNAFLKLIHDRTGKTTLVLIGVTWVTRILEW